MPQSYDFLKSCAGKLKHKTWFVANYFLQNEHCDPLAKIYKCKCGYYHIGGHRGTTGKKIVKHKNRENDQEHKRKHKRFKY